VAVVDDLADGTLVSIPIIQPIVRNTVYLVTDPQRQQSRAGKYVQETVRTVVRELVRRQIWHGELCVEALR
jgi:LysR family transcriptional regulator, nitrogen assimilation regulatory protein